MYQNVVSAMKGNVLIVSGLYNVQHIKNMDFVGIVKILQICVRIVVAVVNVDLEVTIVASHTCLNIKIEIVMMIVVIDG